jgi:hypothetical protein
MTDTFTPEPNDQMIEPELGNEDMEAWLDSLGESNVNLPALMRSPMMRSEGGADEPNPDDEPDDGDEPTPDEGTPEQVEGVDYFTVNGNQFSRADIERLYSFDQYMRANPEAAQRVAEAIQPAPTGQPPVSPATPPTPGTVDEWQEPTPPETLDLEDPRDKIMWDMQLTAQRTAWEARQEVRKLNQSIVQDKQEQIQRQAAADMDTALSDFRAKFPGLNDDDVAAIRQEAVPFVDGMMKQLPPVDALFRSMEVAAYANTDLRKKLEAETPTPTARQHSRSRKQRLGSIAGTPRSAPKVEARPAFTNDRDMVNAVAQELSDAMGQR